MRYRIIVIALLLMLPVSSASASLYEDILNIEKREIMEDETEETIKEFVTKVYELEPPLSGSDVEAFLSGDRDKINEVCNNMSEPWAGCYDVIGDDIEHIAKREARIRELGRDLQLIAAGYEMPIGDHPGRMLALAPRFPSIIRIWESTNDYLTNSIVPWRVRASHLPQAVDDPLRELQSALRNVKNSDRYEEEFTALVWRYRYGVKEIIDEEGPCGSKELDKTEQQFLHHRWCDVETKLEAVFSEAPLPNGLAYGETVIYPLRLLRDIDVVVWIRKSQQDGQSDIGLEWDIPLEPALPSLHCDQSASQSPTTLSPSSASRSPSSTPSSNAATSNRVTPSTNSPSANGFSFGGIRRRSSNATTNISSALQKPSTPTNAQANNANASTSPDTPEQCVKRAILGGIYPDPPPEPDTGEKLCRGTFAKKGYLCRPMEDLQCPLDQSDPACPSDCQGCSQTPCPPNSPSCFECLGECITCMPWDSDVFAGHDNELIFRKCVPEGRVVDTKVTESGPNACEIGGWRHGPLTIDDVPVVDTAAPDPTTITGPYDCANCAVDVYCESDAPDPSLGCSNGFAIIYGKEDNGVIPVCIPDEPQIPAAYLILHELIHVQQYCNQPQGTRLNSTVESCCAMEQDGYLAHCNAMVEDGIFEGTEIDVELCTNALVNKSCEHLQPSNATNGVCTSFYTQSYLDDMADRILELSEKNPANVPATCQEAMANKDPRVERLLTSLPLVCSDECQAQYENTIGNNACYIAQCTEQSLETHRLLPGRMPFVSQDQSFPWDGETPLNPMIGSILPIPPLPLTKLPPYNPALLVQTVDLSICQRGSDPLLAPSVQCQFNLLRHLNVPSSSTVLSSNSLLDQASRSDDASEGVISMLPSIGTRIGTNMYEEYLRKNVRTFSDLTTAATHIIGGIAEIEFADQMCPRIEETP